VKGEKGPAEDAFQQFKNQSPTNIWDSELTNRLIELPSNSLSWTAANAALPTVNLEN
jgi:hypothetical protein